jgi:hypothetical protein
MEGADTYLLTPLNTLRLPMNRFFSKLMYAGQLSVKTLM